MISVAETNHINNVSDDNYQTMIKIVCNFKMNI